VADDIPLLDTPYGLVIELSTKWKQKTAQTMR
jgi:hypothetical protein